VPWAWRGTLVSREIRGGWQWIHGPAWASFRRNPGRGHRPDIRVSAVALASVRVQKAAPAIASCGRAFDVHNADPESRPKPSAFGQPTLVQRGGNGPSEPRIPHYRMKLLYFWHVARISVDPESSITEQLTMLRDRITLQVQK